LTFLALIHSGSPGVLPRLLSPPLGARLTAALHATASPSPDLRQTAAEVVERLDPSLDRAAAARGPRADGGGGSGGGGGGATPAGGSRTEPGTWLGAALETAAAAVDAGATGNVVYGNPPRRCRRCPRAHDPAPRPPPPGTARRSASAPTGPCTRSCVASSCATTLYDATLARPDAAKPDAALRPLAWRR
jgi:hypothetical protein